MKLESLENYRRDTANFRWFAVAVIILSLAGNVIIYFKSRQDVAQAYERIWVVDRNFRPYIAEVRKQGSYKERVFEYEEAVREFYENALSW